LNVTESYQQVGFLQDITVGRGKDTIQGKRSQWHIFHLPPHLGFPH